MADQESQAIKRQLIATKRQEAAKSIRYGLVTIWLTTRETIRALRSWIWPTVD